MPLKSTFLWLSLVLVLIILLVADLSMGSVRIPFIDVAKILSFQSDPAQVWKDIVWDFRMTKALTCILAGGSLSLSGLQMQTLFRNPLAGPDVLGLTSGASLAVSLIFLTRVPGSFLSPEKMPWAVAIAASLGCAAVFFIMLLFARRLQDNVSLLIVGLMIGAATSSVVSVLQYLSKSEELQVYVIWTFGSLGGLNWNELSLLLIVLAMGSGLALYNMKALNAWLLGDLYALNLGINVRRARLIMIISGSLLTGAVTAFCGPIAFVGLAVPHLVKLMANSTNHKILIPAVIIGGASLLLLCDIISQLPGDFILPINAITAMIGAPVVIWIILNNRRLQL